MSTKRSETIKAGILRGSGGRETGEGEVVFVMFMLREGSMRGCANNDVAG